MKKPKTIQEKWMWGQMELTKDWIKNIKKTIKESMNPVTTDPLNYQKSQLEYNLKMQKQLNKITMTKI